MVVPSVDLKLLSPGWNRTMLSVHLCVHLTSVGLKKVCRLTMIQWSILTKCGLFFNIVSPVIHIGVAVLGFLWYSSSHPYPGKSLQLQL